MTRMTGEAWIVLLKENHAVEVTTNRMIQLIRQWLKEHNMEPLPGKFIEGEINLMLPVQDPTFHAAVIRYFQIKVRYHAESPSQDNQKGKMDMLVTDAMEYTHEEYFRQVDEDMSDRCLQEAIKIINTQKK